MEVCTHAVLLDIAVLFQIILIFTISPFSVMLCWGLCVFSSWNHYRKAKFTSGLMGQIIPSLFVSSTFHNALSEDTDYRQFKYIVSGLFGRKKKNRLKVLLRSSLVFVEILLLSSFYGFFISLLHSFFHSFIHYL